MLGVGVQYYGREAHLRYIPGIGRVYAMGDGAGMVFQGNMTSLRLSGGDWSWELQLRISNHECDIVRDLRCGMSFLCGSGSEHDLIRSRAVVAIIDVLHGRLAYVGTRESYLDFIMLLCQRTSNKGE